MRPTAKALRRAPTVAIGGRSLRLARDGAVRVLVRCPSLARGTCRLALELSARRPLILRDGRRLVHLGVARRTVAAGRTRSIAIALSRRTARAVRSRGAVAVVLQVTARDASGRARTTRKRFALHAARR